MEDDIELFDADRAWATAWVRGGAWCDSEAFREPAPHVPVKKREPERILVRPAIDVEIISAAAAEARKKREALAGIDGILEAMQIYADPDQIERLWDMARAEIRALLEICPGECRRLWNDAVQIYAKKSSRVDRIVAGNESGLLAVRYRQ